MGFKVVRQTYQEDLKDKKMATSKFKAAASPMINYDKVHHNTDYLYDRYTKSFAAPKTQKPMPEGIGRVLGVALFGIGRAGGIHLRNLLGNARCDLLYVVETDDDRWRMTKASLNLTDKIVRVRSAGDVDKVLRDR